MGNTGIQNLLNGKLHGRRYVEIRQNRLFVARGLKRMEKIHWVGTIGGVLLKIPGPDMDCRAIEEEEEEEDNDEGEEEEEEEEDFNSS